MTNSLLGKRFGKLVVIGNGKKTNRGRATYRCKCDCGNEKDVEGYELKNGKIKSCGCLRRFSGKRLKEIQESYNIDGVQITSFKRKVNKNNKTGVKGVMFCEIHKKYRARISVKGEVIHLGWFETLDKAIEARLKAEEIYYLPYLKKSKKFKKQEPY